MAGTLPPMRPPIPEPTAPIAKRRPRFTRKRILAWHKRRARHLLKHWYLLVLLGVALSCLVALMFPKPRADYIVLLQFAVDYLLALK